METLIHEIITDWMNGNRKQVIQTLSDQHPSRPYLAAVVAARLNMDQLRTFLDMLQNAIPEEKKYKITVNHDPDTDNPCTDGDGRWQIYTTNSKEFLKLLDPDTDSEYALFNAETLTKLKTGLAFVLSYSEHGRQCQWDLKNTDFNPNEVDAIAVWEETEENLGPITYLHRQIDCRQQVQEYTQWCNGDCYWFKIEQYGNFLAIDKGIVKKYLQQSISNALPNDATKDNTEIVDPLGVLSYTDVFSKPDQSLTPVTDV